LLHEPVVESQALKSFQIIPLDQGYLVKAEFRDSAVMYMADHTKKSKMSLAFESYIGVEQYLRTMIKTVEKIEFTD
jgi:D-hexose-6-phosphate mutarotase